MSEKEECPVCKAYSSDIFSAFQRGEGCPRCGTSLESIESFKEIEEKKKYYQSQKVQQELIDENQKLKEELIIKKDRYQKLKDVVWNMYYEMQKLTTELDEQWMKKIKDWDEE